jgi:hemoglobin
LFLGALGCTEGQKPSPLQRAAGTKPGEVAVKPAETPPAAKPSLYERLGKEEAITKVVDDFVANVVADENIKERHKKHFMEGEVAGLKKKLVEQIGEATGGPQKYTGKNMKDAHKGLEITNKDFDALAGDLVKALEKNKVSKEDKDEIVKMLETMRKDVVEKPD